jgi:hypothetical protein
MSKNHLNKTFLPQSYEVHLDSTSPSVDYTGKVRISMRKIRPSKRITLHMGKDLSITNVKCVATNKGQSGEIEFYRHYHHKKLEEMRFYSDKIIYPCQLEIDIDFKSNQPLDTDLLKKIKEIGGHIEITPDNAGLWRNIFPLIDEPSQRISSKIVVS